MNDGSITTPSLLLAQTAPGTAPTPNAAPPAPTTTEVVGLPTQPTTGSAPATGTITVPGTPPPAGARAPGGGDFTFLILMFGLLLFLIIMSVMGSRKEKKKRAELMGNLSNNDRVQTIGGMIGTVVEIRDEEVVLRVDENSNTRIRFSKTAIQQIIRKADGSKPGQSGAQAEAKPEKSKVSV